jgi:hypothetical protein
MVPYGLNHLSAHPLSNWLFFVQQLGDIHVKVMFFQALYFVLAQPKDLETWWHHAPRLDLCATST